MNNLSSYINSGFALIKIPLNNKGPSTVNWNLKENAISDLKQLPLLVGANIGLAHAYCSPHPTCAIDFDDLEKAQNWFQEHGVNIKHYIDASNAVQIISGRPNRLKLLYRLPDQPLRSHVIKDEFQTIIEFRCASREGLTLQDVLPPSIHPDTNLPYAWGGSGSYKNIPMIPEDILTLWKILIIPKSKDSKVSVSTLAETPKNIAILLDALNQISSDCDYESYRNIVWAIKSTGWTIADEIALIWSQKAMDRFNEETFNNLINSYSFNHTNPITVGTIFHLARTGAQK